MDTDAPYRELEYVEIGPYVYKNMWTETFEQFAGEEIIFHEREKVYELRYSGEFVK
ncbi:DUF5680 domain-containing protein [Anoxybacteroides tepidamans]|uniref:DUF5680 domain-containing protein n=1 Tax=Anoxybacteroides tepidamans TaxID=265948 RepID=UPI000AC18F12|nr:DUF5680 domain-containing protein [Anoxybacillus tepidamans]